MNQPWWKKALSYLWDIQVDYRSSEYNPDLIVFLSQGRYQLCTSNAVYSYEDKYHNFKEIIFNHIDYGTLQANNVLVLGLGLGSVPQMLDMMKPKHWNFTTVEIDEEVSDLAAIYGYPNILSDINTITTDAHTYVQIVEEQYDIICVDVFVGDNTPQKFRTTAFLEDVKVLTAKNGYVVYNTPAFNDLDKKVSREFYEEVFTKVYPEGRLIDAHRNYMLIWQNV